MKAQLKIQAPGTRPRTTFHYGHLYVGLESGQRYEVAVTNTTGRRILAVVTVDGRNVLTGEPGRSDGSGVIVPANSTYVFEGWRTDMSTVAAFRLAPPGESYAAQLGDASNVGVIGLAVFDEKSYWRSDYSPTRSATAKPASTRGGSGTAFGEERSSHVTTATFERATVQPVETCSLRYDDVESLIARGILPPNEPTAPNPFPADTPLGQDFCKPPTR